MNTNKQLPPHKNTSCHRKVKVTN